MEIKVTYSHDNRYFYVTGFEFHRPRSWVSVELEADGRRHVLPFAFYRLLGGQVKHAEAGDDLVQLYAESVGWPATGTEQWKEELTRAIDQAEYQVAVSERTLNFHKVYLDHLKSLQK